jgi:Ankyrin repeats (3 copies)
MSKAEHTNGREQPRAHGAQGTHAPNGPEAAAARALVEAVESGDSQRVASLIASGAFADARLRGGETPLMRASSRGYSDIARALLDAGADASARRADGFTPLILAAFFGHEDVARLLLERGADASARTALGTTAERWAASRGFEGMTTILRAAAQKPARAEASAPKARAAKESFKESFEDLSIFSRARAAEDSEATRVGVARKRREDDFFKVDEVKVDEGARLKSSGAESSEAPFVEAGRDEERTSVFVRDDVRAPSHPSESAFGLGGFLRSWQASIGTALLLLAVGVGAYALWRNNARESAKPAPQPQPTASQQPAPAQVVAAPQPTPNGVPSPTPLPEAGYPYQYQDPASMPYYVPPAAANVPPQANIPKELTVVSESGAPTPDDSARTKRKPEPTPAPAQPARGGDDSQSDSAARDADRNSRDAAPRPAPAARPTPPPSATPERGKVIQWPPQ